MVAVTVTGIKVGTGDFGISPGDGELCMTLRAEYEEEMKEIEEGILTFSRNLCSRDGIDMDHTIIPSSTISRKPGITRMDLRRLFPRQKAWVWRPFP